MKDLEKTLKALANRRRLTVLKYLKNNKEASVGEIAGVLDVSFKATSKHLSVLHAADIVDRNQRSSQMIYRLTDTHKPAVSRILNLL